DEPTNHLDAESVAWLERFLEEYPGTVIAVTHDRYFLDQVAGWILELDRGKAYPFEGNYTGWLEQKEARLAQQKREDDSRRKVLARELEWVRSSQKARQSKGKARLNRYDELVAESSTRAIEAGRIQIPP
ncbi:MAG TPA: energy-dependent translational throttle protein EttA, partial [Deltaproteobacteria bacterium]|nr:energy-dependent translational throttle protein EttA [Deltaproteobacteria bacterium]